VDALLQQTGEFKVKIDAAQEAVLDSNPLSANAELPFWPNARPFPMGDSPSISSIRPAMPISVVKWSGILKMVDGVLLLVDGKDGPMPQTRFVLKKSLELGLCPIVVINKIDVEAANPTEALNRTFDLFVNLGATDPQLDFPILYASGRQGWATLDLKSPSKDMKPLFETIIKHVPAPLAHADQPLQMLVTMLDYSDFLGRIGIGRISKGKIAKGQSVVLVPA
jgi:GTP-binding protein